MTFCSSNTCVYTCLIGGYEKLNEQPMAWTSKVPFYCLTDDPTLTSQSWKVILVSPHFPADPVRSQRSLKILPPLGRELPQVDCSLYLDNSVILSRTPEEILDTCLGQDPLAIPDHSFRERVIDEFQEVIHQGLDDQVRVFEQLNHCTLSTPEVLQERPYFTGLLMRRHGNAGVQRMMEIWHAHVLRYSRRDQLSVNLAARLARVEPARVQMDTFQSWCHTWPVVTGRQRGKGLRDPLTSVMPLAGRVQQLERQLEEARQQIERLPLLEQRCQELEADVSELGRIKRELKSHLQARKQEVRDMRDSLSWMLTRPLRSVQKRLHRMPARDSVKPSPQESTAHPPSSGPQVILCPNGRQIFTLPDDQRARELARHGAPLTPKSLQMWKLLLASSDWTHIVDVGANYGEMLVLADLPPSATVIALEPNEEIAACLRQTCAAAQIDVSVLTAALSDREGSATFHTDRTWSGMSTLGMVIDPAHQMHDAPVTVTTLNRIVGPGPQVGQRKLLCKIDVEGHEIAVLKGGLEALQHSADFAVMIEVLHLKDDELDWLVRQFQLEVLDPATEALIRVAPPSAQALRSILTAGVYHSQDLILRRPSHVPPSCGGTETPL